MAERKNYWQETLEKFEKFLKGEELNLNVYEIGYCPVCDKARIVHFYNPDDGDAYCSIWNRRERMRFEPCGHDMSQEKWRPIRNWPKGAQEQYHLMVTPAHQLKIFREKLRNERSAEIKQHEENMKMINECLRNVEKINRSLKRQK
jgi:hypothetical protein